MSALRYAIGYILGKKKKKQRTRKELKVISRKVNIMLTYSTSPRVSEDQKRTVKPRGDTGGQVKIEGVQQTTKIHLDIILQASKTPQFFSELGQS